MQVGILCCSTDLGHCCSTQRKQATKVLSFTEQALGVMRDISSLTPSHRAVDRFHSLHRKVPTCIWFSQPEIASFAKLHQLRCCLHEEFSVILVQLFRVVEMRRTVIAARVANNNGGSKYPPGRTAPVTATAAAR